VTGSKKWQRESSIVRRASSCQVKNIYRDLRSSEALGVSTVKKGERRKRKMERWKDPIIYLVAGTPA